MLTIVAKCDVNILLITMRRFCGSDVIVCSQGVITFEALVFSKE